MMNQNNKNTFRKVLGAAGRMITAVGEAITDSSDYRSWCYQSRVTPVSPAFRAW